MPNSCKTMAFENVKDQVGFCGIWCGSCVVGNGTLRQLSEKYGHLVKAHSLDEWGPADVNWDEFFRSLGSIAAVSVCPGCRKGGGRDNCEMRACATSKKLEECLACAEQHTCKHAGTLDHMRTGAAQAGIFVKSDGTDKRILIDRWAGELRSRWPCCVLFTPDTSGPTPSHADEH
jgi:hypothetical protein